jgi:hypothetical protein
MDDLIEALQIMRKYANPKFPTHCEHDIMYVAVDPNLVSKEDLVKLVELGFDPAFDDNMFYSSLYGSC